MDARDIELREELIVQQTDSPPILQLDYRSPASRPQTMTTLELADAAAAEQRKGSALAIISLILSIYAVVGTIVLLGAGSWLFYGQESIEIGVIVSLPVTFFCSALFAIVAKSARSDSLLSNCALIALGATVPTAVAFVMAGIHYLPNC